MIQSLHELKIGRCQTAGRIRVAADAVFVTNAHTHVELSGLELPEGTLVTLSGDFDGERIRVDDHAVVHRPNREDLIGGQIALGDALEARAAMYRDLRTYFEKQGFLEVETPVRVMAAGTDPYLESVSCAGASSLQTSPEFAMKRLLAHGCERIFQICKAFRAEEVTPVHNPEFTVLEFYRAWQPVDSVIDDVEALVRLAVPRLRTETFIRRTMADVVHAATGIDLAVTPTAASLSQAVESRALFKPRPSDGWEEIFFELMVTCVDPYLAKQPPTFVTHWPTPLAVLARCAPDDPAVALRFELYVEGIELCNGFEELTDPVEQRERFRSDIAYRAQRGLPIEPMPEGFLRAMEWGLPPSAGVAVGLDRLLMLRLATRSIDDVLPFWWGAERF